jgi:hypothetical protein
MRDIKYIMEENAQSELLELERYRFAQYQPQGVECMALSKDRTLLAVGKEC